MSYGHHRGCYGARHAPQDCCPECFGKGKYFTEWSDSAEADPKLKALVLYYPEEPDGTVEIRCSRGCFPDDWPVEVVSFFKENPNATEVWQDPSDGKIFVKREDL